MRKATLALLLVVLGLAGWDAVMDGESDPTTEQSEIRTLSDGTPPPPND